VVRPCTGERVSGDATFLRHDGPRTYLALLDALGHGGGAHTIAQRGLDALEAPWASDPAEALKRLDHGLRGTAGAVGTAAVLDRSSGLVRAAGIGNVSLEIIQGSELRTRLVATAGILGQRMRTPRVQEFPLEDGNLLVLHSDGVSPEYGSKAYPQIRLQGCRAIARSLVRRYGTVHDDATCLVVRYRR
jgi:serine phosphatase RsbU (regulator of sigma subunit)